MKPFEIKFSFETDKEGVIVLNWRVFFISVIAGFLMASLQMLGVTPSALLSPIVERISTETKVDILRNVRPLLEGNINQFTLKKETSIITPSFASIQADKASAYAVVDLNSGQVLLDKSFSKREPIASLTKLMTAVVALDLASPTDIFTISENAARVVPTRIGVVSGEKMTLDELLHALLLTSANDAAQVIKEGVEAKYGSRLFIDAMNAKANFLGLKNTHFQNPQGFDSPENYSSAQDMAILTQYALTQYPLIASIVKKDYKFLPPNENHKVFDLYNWNGLIGVYPGVYGVKIGNTNGAGKTTIVVADRDGKKLLVVLLGAPEVVERDLWAAQLLDVGYEMEYKLPAVQITQQQLRDKYSTWRYGG